MNNIEKVRSMGLEPLLTKLTIQSAFSSMNKISTRVSQCQDILRALKRVVEAAQYTEHKIMDVGKSLSKKVINNFFVLKIKQMLNARYFYTFSLGHGKIY